MGHKTIRRVTCKHGDDLLAFDFEDCGYQHTFCDDNDDGPEAARLWECEQPLLQVWEMAPFEQGWIVGDGESYGTADSFDSAAICAIANYLWRD